MGACASSPGGGKNRVAPRVATLSAADVFGTRISDFVTQHRLETWKAHMTAMKDELILAKIRALRLRTSDVDPETVRPAPDIEYDVPHSMVSVSGQHATVTDAFESMASVMTADATVDTAMKAMQTYMSWCIQGIHRARADKATTTVGVLRAYNRLIKAIWNSDASRSICGAYSRVQK